MNTTRTLYFCDNCKKELPTSKNSLTISSEKVGPGTEWMRLRVKILCYSGIHNDGKTSDSDLCQECAIALLENALNRVKAGERATKGVESSKEEGWIKR
jgi:uncharacterized protein YlaI